MKNLSFQLPPNITINRQMVGKGFAYVFRDETLGEIGRLVLEGTPNGETHISSEVAGELADPMTPKRLEMFEPLGKELTGILEMMLGKGREAPLAVRERQDMGQVACEESRCETCGEIVAFLIFAEGATTTGLFEDYARLMYMHYTKHNVPTYIIGPELGEGPLEYRAANILKVWPQRGPMEQLRPDEFNPRIHALVTNHC
jgi:hypothetical protein